MGEFPDRVNRGLGSLVSVAQSFSGLFCFSRFFVPSEKTKKHSLTARHYMHRNPTHVTGTAAVSLDFHDPTLAGVPEYSHSVSLTYTLVLSKTSES